jgi:hypothetical protein
LETHNLRHLFEDGISLINEYEKLKEKNRALEYKLFKFTSVHCVDCDSYNREKMLCNINGIKIKDPYKWYCADFYYFSF